MDFFAKLKKAGFRLQNNTLFFWIALVTLNSLFFIPEIVLHPDPQQIIPLPAWNAERGFYDWILFYLRRDNLDLFRLAVDFLIILSVLFFFRKNRFLARIGKYLLIVYISLLVFQTYDTAMFFIFSQHPVLANDINHLLGAAYLIIDISFSKLLLPVIATLILIAVILLLIPFLFRTIVVQISRKKYINIFRVSGIAVLLITIVLTNWFGFYRLKPAVRWVTPKIIQNITESAKIIRYKSLLRQGARDSTYYAYQNLPLTSQPNIYLIMIESYGKILAENDDLSIPYQQMMENYTSSLLKNNWHSVSGYSEAPISGGISWLSIATVLNGSKIKDQAIYSLLLDSVHDLPNMFRFFNSKGYQTYNLQPMNRPRAGYSFEPYHKMYGYQTPIFFDVLNYNAADFGFGHIPDQLVLYTAHQNFLSRHQQPYFLFFITASSHYPWLNTPKFFPEWGRCREQMSELSDTADFVTRISQTYHFKYQNQAHYAEYLNAINYEINIITDYIINLAPANSIFIILGDHQPPIITSEKNSFETPVHVISKDSLFLANWHNFGLNRGMYPKTELPAIKHASIYSRLINSLLWQYSDLPKSMIPNPKPDGIRLVR